jgi:prolyl-tRNA synthetase
VHRHLRSRSPHVSDAGAEGIVWPVPVAPFKVAAVVLGTTGAPVAESAESLLRQLRAEQADLLLDNLNERPTAAKFSDVDLIGIP